MFKFIKRIFDFYIWEIYISVLIRCQWNKPKKKTRKKNNIKKIDNLEFKELLKFFKKKYKDNDEIKLTKGIIKINNLK